MNGFMCVGCGEIGLVPFSHDCGDEDSCDWIGIDFKKVSSPVLSLAVDSVLSLDEYLDNFYEGQEHFNKEELRVIVLKMLHNFVRLVKKRGVGDDVEE